MRRHRRLLICFIFEKSVGLMTVFKVLTESEALQTRCCMEGNMTKSMKIHCELKFSVIVYERYTQSQRFFFFFINQLKETFPVEIIFGFLIRNTSLYCFTFQ